jgi:hypothetical protein
MLLLKWWEIELRQTWSIRPSLSEAGGTHRIRPRVHMGWMSYGGSHGDGGGLIEAQVAFWI